MKMQVRDFLTAFSHSTTKTLWVWVGRLPQNLLTLYTQGTVYKEMPTLPVPPSLQQF
jgi:hypothetical protein